MGGKLNEVLQTQKKSLIVFGETFLVLTSSKLRKSHEVDEYFYRSTQQKVMNRKRKQKTEMEAFLENPGFFGY